MILYLRPLASLICVAFSALLPFDASADEEDEIVTGCHHSNAEWGSEMIDRCVKDNQATRAIVLQYPEQHKQIVDRCRRGNELGWSWVKTCVDRDIEAESALAQYPKERAGLIDVCHADFGHRGAAVVKACVDRVIKILNSPNNP
ncbi:MAG: hypothetical protein M3Q00_10415 [Pseudomonadota bacterium]|nr:hypothetical protein [Pseudomonadota bacterium]